MPTGSSFGSGGSTDQTPWETATFTKPDVTAAGSSGAWTTTNSPITIFTVTGLVLLRCFAVVTTAITSTGSTGTLRVVYPGIAGGTAISAITNATTADGNNFPTGAVWGGSATVRTGAQLMLSDGTFFVANSTTIQLLIATNDMDAGGMTIYCQWIALSGGATVVAATP